MIENFGTINDFPIDYLHLPLRYQRSLLQSNIQTVKEVEDLVSSQEIRAIKRIGYSGEKEIVSRLIFLNKARNLLGETDVWEKFWTELKIRLIPNNTDSEFTTYDVIKNLQHVIKDVVTSEYDERTWIILQRRYGLEGARINTLEELGVAFGISRERARQIESKALEFLRKVLIMYFYEGEKFRVRPSFFKAVERLSQVIVDNTNNLICESVLIEKICQEFSVDEKSLKQILPLLLELLGIRKIKFNSERIDDILIPSDQLKPAIIQDLILMIDDFLTSHTTSSTSDFDVLQFINNKLPKKQQVNIEVIRTLLYVCSSVQRRDDGNVWGKMECLKGVANQAERILFEYKAPLDSKIIVRKINHKLVPLGRSKVNLRTLQNALSQDQRFTPIGRSGQWGLISWVNIESASILELMEECFIVMDRPLTENDVFDYVKQKRPVKKHSITSYLYSGKFKKVVASRWVLTGWSEADDSQPWDKSQVANFVASMFRKKRDKKMPYKEIKLALMKAADVNEKRARFMLNVNPVIKTYIGENRKERVAVFQPDYQKELDKKKKGYRRKKVTLLDKISELTKMYLDETPGQQAYFRETVNFLEKEIKCPRQTIYRYLSLIDSIEKFEIPGMGIKMIRIKNQKISISFPSIEKIHSDQLRSNIERAIKYLNPSEVDIGLFLLSKEFEAIIKDYFVLASKKNLISTENYLGNDPSKWKLDKMVECAKHNGIISDSSTFSYLRHQRNDRAHGKMPTNTELDLQYKGVQLLASMYIDAIILFETTLLDIS